LNFAVNFGVRNLQSRGYHAALFCIILRLAVLIQYRSVTDTQTERHTTTEYTSLSIASCGENEVHDVLHCAEFMHKNFCVVTTRVVITAH